MYYWKIKAISGLTKLVDSESNNNDGPARHAQWCNSDMNSMGITNHPLIGFKLHSRRWNPHQHQYRGPKPVASQALEENLLLLFT